MASNATTTIRMTIPATFITEIPLSTLIFSTSSLVTFANDTNAYTTVDINYNKITDISSWC
jgi:hypothetical protein